jgi:hypothetical protein
MTSSEPGSARSGTLQPVRFPPRAELPPGIVIRKLPALGTTWYERGFAYWTRRAGMLIVLIATAAIYLAVISGVVRAAGPPGSPGFLAVLTTEAVFTVVTGVLIFRHAWRAGISGQIANARAGRNRGAAGASAGLLAASAGTVGAFFIVLGAVLTAGGVLAIIAGWLVPVLPVEQHARRQVAEALQQNQQNQSEHPVANPRSKHHGSH